MQYTPTSRDAYRNAGVLSIQTPRSGEELPSSKASIPKSFAPAGFFRDESLPVVSESTARFTTFWIVSLKLFSLK